MVMIEPNKQATATAPLPAATKKVNPKKPVKEGAASNAAIAARKGKGDGQHVSRLGKLPGLSITRAGELQASNEEMAQTLAKSSKSSMDDLSKQLQSELKRSKENIKPPQGNPKPKQRPTNLQGKPQSSNRSTEVHTVQKPLEPGQVLASTLPTPPSKPLVTPSKPLSNAAAASQPRSGTKPSSTPQNKQPTPKSQSKSGTASSAPSPAATPAKTEQTQTSTASPSASATELDSPALQRKRLLEMIAAERADEEKRRKAKRLREEQRKSRAKAQAQANPSNQPRTNVPSKPHADTENPKSVALDPRVKQEPKDQGQGQQKSRPRPQPHQAASVKRDQASRPPAPIPQPIEQRAIKKELIDQLDFSQGSLPVPVDPLQFQAPQLSSNVISQQQDDILRQQIKAKQQPSQLPFGLTPQQNDILNQQFQVKDYLSRKEMRALAIQTGLTDAKVRDWFKQKRIDEDVPTIVSEKPAEFILNPPNVKEEPQEHTDYGFESPASNDVSGEATDEVPVKQEPVEDESGPDSAVLDPVSGKLVKQRSIDKDMETIMSKAPILESLAKKIEKVNTTGNSFKESFQAKVGDIIDILDDDIVITQENIVNPGPKERPMSKVLNKFLSQVEELEKNISEGQNGSNFNLMRDNKRKEEDLVQMSSEVERQSLEIRHLEKELQDKNDEIESILLNSVSKETFVRTQFQNLTTEVRQLRKENEEKKTLEEKLKELEKLLRNKTHDCDDWKEKYDNTVANMKELEETSTNMIGEITKGVGEKLALAKSREKDLRLIEEKNLLLVEEVSKLEKQLIQLNHDHYKAREDLETRLKEKDGAISLKDDEIEKLKGQVSNLTKRFKDKVKEIQETLSKYNETLKVKNVEMAEKSKEIERLKDNDGSQGKLITMLKASVEKFTTQKEILNKTLEITKLDLSAKDKEIEDLKAQVKVLSSSKNAWLIKGERKTKQRKLKTVSSPESAKRKLKPKTTETGSPQKKLKLEINTSLFSQPLLLPPLKLLRLPLFEIVKPPQQAPSEQLSVTQREEIKDYPVVLYSRNQVLDDLLLLLRL